MVKLIVPKKIGATVMFTLVAVLLLLCEYFYGQEQVQATNVGGKMNQCTCSQRLGK